MGTCNEETVSSAASLLSVVPTITGGVPKISAGLQGLGVRRADSVAHLPYSAAEYG